MKDIVQWQVSWLAALGQTNKRSIYRRAAKVFVDETSLVFAALPSVSQGNGWFEGTDQLHVALLTAGRRLGSTAAHWRGMHTAITAGVSHGGGRQVRFQTHAVSTEHYA